MKKTLENNFFKMIETLQRTSREKTGEGNVFPRRRD